MRIRCALALAISLLGAQARAESLCHSKASVPRYLDGDDPRRIKLCLDHWGNAIGASMRSLQTGDEWIWLGADEVGLGELAHLVRIGSYDRKNEGQALIEAYLKRRAALNAPAIALQAGAPTCARRVNYDDWTMTSSQKGAVSVCLTRDGVAEGVSYNSPATNWVWTWFSSRELIERGWILTEGGMVRSGTNWRLPAYSIFRPRRPSRELDWLLKERLSASKASAAAAAAMLAIRP